MKQYVSLPELAKLLGISRIAVYQKVKKGQIPAIRIGRAYGVDVGHIASILGKKLTEKNKEQVNAVVNKALKEYGGVYERLAKE